jgi:spermidine synthase
MRPRKSPKLLLINLLSFLYPITRKVTSPFNGQLEISWYDGKKYLNTRNTNYSYGSLQRTLAFGLQQIQLSEVQNILLLGMGGGSVIQSLRNELGFPHKILAIEIDPVVIEIASREFQISGDSQLEIMCADAFQFIQTQRSVFGLIMIDLFLDKEIPERVFDEAFWEKIRHSCQQGGYILFNTMTETLDPVKMEKVFSWLEKSFHLSRFDHVEGTNTLLLGRKK